MPNINITIPDELHQQLKLSAIAKRMTIKEFVIERLQEQVQTEPMLRHPPTGTTTRGGDA